MSFLLNCSFKTITVKTKSCPWFISGIVERAKQANARESHPRVSRFLVWGDHGTCCLVSFACFPSLRKRGLRAVFRDTHLNYQQLLDKANLPTLCNRRLQDICILMYKAKHNLCPRPIYNLFQPSNHTYQLRQTDFALPRFNTTTYGQHSLRYLGSKLWHNLSRKERLTRNLNTFKWQIPKRDLSSLLKDGCTACHLCNS